MEEKIVELRKAILNYDAEKAKIISESIDPTKNFIELVEAIKTALTEVGGKFERGEIFLPHLVLAADAAMAVYEVIKSKVSKEEMSKLSLGTVVLGTVEGDMHDIGVNVVEMNLRAAGFTVINIGKNVHADAFIAKARDSNADVIGISSLMTVTMPKMKEVIEELQIAGFRDKLKVIVGGGPVTEDWSKEIGADGYGKDAIDAAKIIKKWQGVD